MRGLATISLLQLLLVGKLSLAATPPHPESTCPYQTANYIVHGLPQQCLADYHKPYTTSESSQTTVSPSHPNSNGGPGVSSETTDESSPESQSIEISIQTVTQASTTSTLQAPGGSETPFQEPEPPTHPQVATTTTTVIAEPIHHEEETQRDLDIDPDSALDSTKFLSFEEWRAQNLANAGQGQVRQNLGERGIREPRKRPGGMNNDIDSIGDDAEIDLNFGFGSGSNQPSAGGATKGTDGIDGDIIPPKGQSRSKNAGKTGKERFNYASFDCAATVHKTNPGVKGTNAILVENKDSYMLIKCAEKNKFIIVELCDDILVDTVVLANFEFFSSMFREFRVSVSDRYPIKASGWKELGVFTGRNSREIQPFMVDDPKIWARYMKIEFLSHYGNEFYCPISLIRVHGTTMMEEFKAQEEAARGVQEDDVEEIVPEVVAEEIKQSIAEDEAAQVEPTEEPQVELPVEGPEVRKPTTWHTTAVPKMGYLALPPPSRFTCTTSPRIPIVFQRDSQACSAIPVTYSTAPGPAYATKSMLHLPTDQSATIEEDHKQTISASAVNSGPTRPVKSKTELYVASPSTATEQPTPSTESHPQPPKEPKQADPPPQERPVEKVHARRPSGPPPSGNPPPTYIPRHAPPVYVPPAPSPPYGSAPTQDNFFKTIHKRLQTLEVDATLSLQYIEEQSKALIDTFAKMEKLQTAKTQKFMEKLNGTVMNELLLFRRQYDQLHQSTVIALESHRRQTSASESELSEQIAILAEEVLYQRKFGYVQSFLLLVCILLVIFNQSQTFIENPLLNSVKAQTIGGVFRRLESPPNSPPTPTSRFLFGRRGPGTGNLTPSSGLRHMRTQSDSLDLASISSPDLPSQAHHTLSDTDCSPSPSPAPSPNKPLLAFSPPTPPASSRNTPAPTSPSPPTPKSSSLPRRTATEPPLDAWLEYPTLESVLDGSSPANGNGIIRSGSGSSGSQHSHNGSLEDAPFDGSEIEILGDTDGGTVKKRLKRKRKGLPLRSSLDGSESERGRVSFENGDGEGGEERIGRSEFGGTWSEPVWGSRGSSRSSAEGRIGGSDDDRDGQVSDEDGVDPGWGG